MGPGSPAEEDGPPGGALGPGPSFKFGPGARRLAGLDPGGGQDLTPVTFKKNHSQTHDAAAEKATCYSSPAGECSLLTSASAIANQRSAGRNPTPPFLAPDSLGPGGEPLSASAIRYDLLLSYCDWDKNNWLDYLKWGASASIENTFVETYIENSCASL